MILVVDSGSYKSDWMLQPEGMEALRFRTKGINPFFTTEKEIIRIIQHLSDLKQYSNQIEEIYFYGSGCTSPDRREIISNSLSHVFHNAFISVDTDVIGSAYATCGNKEGFIATIGTGSNTSFFDGESIQTTKLGLGYILGDIGSGAWFGVELITSYLYGSLPHDLHIAFEEKYALTKEKVVQNVYQRSRPNVYLASFAPFLSEYQNHSYISALIHKGFEKFVQANICLYPNYKDHICHFVGSIAYHFRLELQNICKIHGINVGKILQQPIQDLYHYVIEREKLESSI